MKQTWTRRPSGRAPQCDCFWQGIRLKGHSFRFLAPPHELWRQAAFKSCLKSTGSSMGLITSIPSLIPLSSHLCRYSVFDERSCRTRQEITVFRWLSWCWEGWYKGNKWHTSVAPCHINITNPGCCVNGSWCFFMNYSAFSPMEAHYKEAHLRLTAE